jgi:aminoglycoside/choline kinase family phosphotransferase
LPWALTALGGSDLTSASDTALILVTGDASNRRYFRLLREGKSYIVAEAPPETEKNREFVAIRTLLANAQVRVPAILAADIERGYLLLEDLGDQTLLPALNGDSVDRWYEQAEGILQKMAAVDLKAIDIACYDHALFSEELSRFSEWFVEGLLDYSLVEPEREIIARFSAVLLESALEQPQVLVHRDFHSRNLMIIDDKLALIDFQDAVAGPVTYDIGSLLKDCYIRWPQAQVEQWALAYKQQLCAADLMCDVSDERFLRWFDAMALQRHIKVLGTFARLYLRDGKASYLEDLPMVLSYVRETLDRYAGGEPAFADFSLWFADNLGQHIANQTWSAPL